MDHQSALSRLRATVARFAAVHLPAADAWCVALSGGPDSLALTAAAAPVLPTTALIIDHALQPGSADVAETARRQALELGCVDARVVTVRVGSRGGPEAAARAARYAGLEMARGGTPVLLGHTLDDQAETVLLGLGRGSGPRSIAGMRDCDPPWFRPLLAERRSTTVAAVAELGLAAWNDPHNADSRFTRVRLRSEVLPLLEEVLGGGVAEALARTAAALREDTDLLDTMAAAELAASRGGAELAASRGGAELAASRGGAELAVSAVRDLPDPLRRRVLRAWLLDGGACDLTESQIRAVDALVSAWRGQGGVAVGCPVPRTRLFAERRHGNLVLRREPV